MALWVLSAIMSMGFFSAYAGVSLISLIVAGSLSGALEMTKVLSWRRGSWYRLLSALLSMMTLLSVLGTTLSAIEHREANSLHIRLQAVEDRRDYKDGIQLQRALESQLQGVSERLEGTPSDWPTVFGKLSVEAKQLRQELRDVTAKLDRMELTARSDATTEAPSIFATLANQIGAKPSQVELSILLTLALLVEISAFSLSGKVAESKAEEAPAKIGRRDTQQPSLIAQSDGVTPMDYLRVALDSPKAPILLGRGPCSRKLGITPAQSRNLLQLLIEQGLVTRKSKFFVAVE